MRGLGALTALVLAASAAPAGAETLDVYSSLPLQGAGRAQTTAMVKGMRLALQQAGGLAGPFTIHYVSLDDSTRQAGDWDPGTVARNARRVESDPQAILYLGDFNSGASAISIPILNEAGVPQISPSNTYDGLTTRVPGDDASDPGRYYPTGRRTYVRLTPPDRVQAAALATQMKADGCRRVAVAADGDLYGAGIGDGVVREASRLGVRVARHIKNTHGRRASSVATTVAAARSDCFLFAGVGSSHAVSIARAVARRVPAARLYGADGVCGGGFPRGIRVYANRFRCTALPLPIASYPGGPGFLDAFHAAFGPAAPDPWAIYGYEAMKVGLDTIAGLGDRGGDRKALVAGLFAVRDRASVLGAYSFDARGDTTLRTYGVYRATSGGSVAFDRAVTAG